MPQQFQFMAVIKGIGTKEKGEGKETELKMRVLGVSAESAGLAELVGKAVNVTIEGSQRGLGET